MVFGTIDTTPLVVNHSERDKMATRFELPRQAQYYRWRRSNGECTMFASLSTPEPFAKFAAPEAWVKASKFSYAKGTEIFGENESADYVYQVAAGAVRSYKLLSDGRRQIGAFHLVGDVFGLENAAVHRFTAEAIVDTKVHLVRRESLEGIAEKDVVVARDLRDVTASSLQHAQDHILLLGRKTALERVAAFLLEMDRRLTKAGFVALPMNRRDIADYLGLTLETVSRALGQLHDRGALSFLGTNQRQIVLLDRKQLVKLDS
jgi:CRP/FNR family transcriptional regulator, nitrogen fixation regulation protein